jgi:DNA-binding LacI/PurR family transcriptional regulator
MPVATRSSNSSPKYLQIAQQLRKQIEAGELKPGDRLPSFVAMRADFGATPATVERVYADLERDSLIRREPGRGTFVAETRQRQSTGMIGFVGSSFSRKDPYTTHIVEGIEDVIRREERRVLLLDHHSSGGWDQVDGVLVCRPNEGEAILRHLPIKLPCVTLMAAVEGFSSVIADDFEGIHQAVEYLHAQGHRRIGYLTESTFPILRQRIAGYYDALREVGIVSPCLRQTSYSHTEINSDYREWGRTAMREWLQDNWKEQACTALLVQNDSAAFGAIESLIEAGISVPQDVSVVGFDGTEICEWMTPSLTSVDVPIQRIAATGVEVLLRHITGKETEPSKTVLSTQLRVRNSTAPAPI